MSQLALKTYFTDIIAHSAIPFIHAWVWDAIINVSPTSATREPSNTKASVSVDAILQDTMGKDSQRLSYQLMTQFIWLVHCTFQVYLTRPSILADNRIQRAVIDVGLTVGSFISKHTSTTVGIELILQHMQRDMQLAAGTSPSDLYKPTQVKLLAI